jgi:hypothetical protein
VEVAFRRGHVQRRPAVVVALVHVDLLHVHPGHGEQESMLWNIFGRNLRTKLKMSIST